MLARFSRLIPLYQGIGPPGHQRAALRLPASGAGVLFFMARGFGLGHAASTPAGGVQLAV